MPRRSIAVVAAAIVVAISAFLLLRSSDDKTPSSTTTPAVTTTSTTPGGAEPTTVADATVIHLVGGQPVGGKRKISVKKGDTIRLKVTSDVPDEIHVHGFDIEKAAAPGKPATFAFTADIDGRFEVESHAGNAQIAEISVNP